MDKIAAHLVLRRGVSASDVAAEALHDHPVARGAFDRRRRRATQRARLVAGHAEGVLAQVVLELLLRASEVNELRAAVHVDVAPLKAEFLQADGARLGMPGCRHRERDSAGVDAERRRDPRLIRGLVVSRHRPDARGQAAALLVTRPILALARRRAVGRLAGPTPLGGALLAAQVTELDLRERGRRFPLEHFRGPQHPARGALGNG